MGYVFLLMEFHTMTSDFGDFTIGFRAGDWTEHFIILFFYFQA
jgi:hypothetical protein